MSSPISPSLPLLKGPELVDFCDYIGCFEPRSNSTVHIRSDALLRTLTSGMLAVIPDSSARSVPSGDLSALFDQLNSRNHCLIFLPLGGPLRERVYQVSCASHYSTFISFLDFSPDYVLFLSGSDSFSLLPLFSKEGVASLVSLPNSIPSSPL